MLKLTVEGVVYEYDDGRLLLAEAREVKTFTGMSVPRWSAGIDEADVDAIQMLIYLAKKRNGETLRFSDLESIDFADIELDRVDEEDQAEENTEAEGAGEQPEAVVQPVDPTPSGDSGTTQTPASTSTSPDSPTTSSTPPPTSTA
ncbi:hypothetical protein ACIRJO_02920 [Streptomyces sp. NPDC102394]|uniref:hypothetical protein n=1 Tax=Streptomyces sp. NPDC102394 TaxID=3366167 RepID=UPI003800E29F